MFSKANLKKIDWLLVAVPIIAVAILSGFLIYSPEQSQNILGSCRGFLTSKLTPYYLGIGLIFLVSTLFLGFTKWGKIKLGSNDDKTQYSTLKWGFMIFTSTMSADIIFYSLSEWMMYAKEPLIQSSFEPLNTALTYSLFHWGPIAWSFYIMLAVVFGYMIYVAKNNKQKFSEACRPLLGKLTDGWMGKVIDIIAIFSLIAATATTFSMSMPLLAAAVKTMTGISDTKVLTVSLIILVVAIYLAASVIGMKAISRLSVVAFSMLGLLLLFVLFDSGSAGFIIESSAKSLGDLVTHFIPMAATVEDVHFTQNWTVYYWAYWMIWCVATPFFIGSISKGRTIRTVIFGGYFWGLLGTFSSFFILSNFGISRQISGALNAVKLLNYGSSYADVIIKLIKTLPDFKIGLILLILAMIGLYSTVFDSITMVISKYSYKSLALSEDPSKLMRSFWAIVFVLLPMALILTDTSFTNIQSVAIITAFPTGIVMSLIVVSFYCEIWMRKNKFKI
ncbi:MULTISPECIES: BCCT family transporter [Lactobacillus]|uniref:BCCT family transporter n=1 Tax=Lactobacillus xujianguonis TaxID=2495899 RepID=A0A437SVJ3_9LACO|nr:MULTISPECIES: BCCT family transporter [Lactobacillus]RVU70946.1 BCCT family transporter [Lactobacillus xujianguonis]RVU73578.1 BCCT family transporter [Lactobacillus xujianguonis]